MESNELPPIKRYITGHDANGITRFEDQVPETLERQKPSTDARYTFALGYATNGFPVDLGNDKDLSTYRSYLSDLPGITIPGGTALRVVDMHPGLVSPMHRTVSLDYGVVIEGEVELILDSGATRLLQRGDVAIQRGTNHAWRNTSTTKWARMLYVLQEANALRFNGKTLGEDYGIGMDGVKPSSE